jgi:hypothetical protein
MHEQVYSRYGRLFAASCLAFSSPFCPILAHDKTKVLIDIGFDLTRS